MLKTYKDSGVNIDAGNEAVERIQSRVRETFESFSGTVLDRIGGYSGIVELENGLLLGGSTDGVGTKLLLAILLNQHDTIGIDLVAMCVNDIVVEGLTPIIFLDYIAMGKQIPKRTECIVGGIVEGCLQASVALIGGEMAEMPGMYKQNHYDVAGFAVGIAYSHEELMTKEHIRPGMYVYGLLSSGVHSNGFTLIRSIFKIDEEKQNDAISMLTQSNAYSSYLGCTLGAELLKPTKIYVRDIQGLRKNHNVVGLVHITGGGLVENPPRIMPPNCAIRLYWGSWEIPPIFSLIQSVGGIEDEEMLRVFNMGLGMLIVTSDKMEGLPLVGEIMKSETNTTQFVD